MAATIKDRVANRARATVRTAPLGSSGKATKGSNAQEVLTNAQVKVVTVTKEAPMRHVRLHQLLRLSRTSVRFKNRSRQL